MKILLKIKPALIVIGTVAMCACAMPASAQNDSAAFRQGYDQGYREGMEAARQGRGNAPGGMIRIEQAYYGVDAARCDARNSIQAAAQGRRSIDIVANNSLCGDPAEGRVKSLSVTYRCANGPSVRSRVREDGVLQIRCR
jgi:hypothetical protein